MREIWKPIKGYEGLYSVSNMGRVKSLAGKQRGTNLMTGEPFYQKRDIIVTQSTPSERFPYVLVHLMKDGKRKGLFVHKLVASHFCEGEGEVVNHKNGIKTDNRAEYLEWVSHRESLAHAVRHGLREADANRTPVVAYDKEGNRVKEFRSIAEAARWCGGDTRTIHRVLKGIKHSHKNFVWKRKF